MRKPSLDAIRQLFVDHDDGEFCAPPRSHLFSVIPPICKPYRFVYTTKPSVISALCGRCEEEMTFGVVGRCGLPNDRDVDWLDSIVRGHACFFVGDADPPDLLVFASLRSRIAISFRGVNDALLDGAGVNTVDRILIELTNAERDAMTLVRQLLPDIDDLLGQRCNSVLESGRKIELEAVLSHATVQPKAILDAVVGYPST